MSVLLDSLRPYQRRGYDTIRVHASRGMSRVVLACPTAGGKTRLAAALIESARSFGSRVLFVVPLIVLVDQTIAELAAFGLTDVGVLRGDDKRLNPDAPIQIASIQTLARRDKPPADVILIDEAHRASSPQYKTHLFAAYPEAIIVGLSATPVNLGGVFDKLETAATYAELIRDGFIAEPFCVGTPRPADLSNVGGGDDYNLEQLEAAMLAGKLVGDVVENWKTHGRGHRTVVFATGVRHSQEIVRQFNEAGVRAEHIDGETPQDVRKACLRRLEDGHTRVVSNVGVLTEGWNQPSVRTCVLARPTKSLALYKQMVGRCLRIHADGQPVVIDHGSCIDHHGLPHADVEWSLKEAPRKPPVTHRMCKGCFAMYPIAQTKCPFCGFEVPVEERKPVASVAALLVPKAVVDEKRHMYDANAERARREGFKPGFASAKFKEKYGAWPPWAWSQATKAAFAIDAAWQARVEHRTKEREHWQEVDRQVKARAAMTPEPEAEEPDIEPNAFEDLLG